MLSLRRALGRYYNLSLNTIQKMDKQVKRPIESVEDPTESNKLNESKKKKQREM